MLIHASMIRKFMQISSALNSYKKNRAYNFTPLGRIYIRGTTQIPYVKNEIMFTFTIRLLTHVTSEETSYPTKSMTSALEFFRYAARVGISILLEPQEAFQPVGFPLCQENRILLCTFIAFTLI